MESYNPNWRDSISGNIERLFALRHSQALREWRPRENRARSRLVPAISSGRRDARDGEADAEPAPLHQSCLHAHHARDTRDGAPICRAAATETPARILRRGRTTGSAAALQGGANVMTISWLTALNNGALALLSMNAKRHSAAKLQRCPDFVRPPCLPWPRELRPAIERPCYVALHAGAEPAGARAGGDSAGDR
eukprot:SAG11_NODE_1178_length_5598_cov_4.168394_2_plen_194_part_00